MVVTALCHSWQRKVGHGLEKAQVWLIRIDHEDFVFFAACQI